MNADLGFIAKQAQISRRTAREKFRWINDFIMRSAPCRDAMIDYLSPEMADFKPILADADLSTGSEFWDRIQICFFECPAQRDVSLQLRDINYLAGLQHMRELAGEKGVVRLVRNACAACPASDIRDQVRPFALAGIKAYLPYDKHTSRALVRDHFFQALCRAGIKARANTPDEITSSDQVIKMDRDIAIKCTGDLAIIAAYYMAAETGQKWVPDISKISS